MWEKDVFQLCWHLENCFCPSAIIVNCRLWISAWLDLAFGLVLLLFLALTRTLATATTDGYYYFSKFAVFLVSLHGSRECGVGETGQQLLCNWSSVANLLAGNLNYLCRSDHGYGSRSRTSCEFQPLHMLCSPTVLAGNGQEALIFINFLATKCTSNSTLSVRVCQVCV